MTAYESLRKKVIDHDADADSVETVSPCDIQPVRGVLGIILRVRLASQSGRKRFRAPSKTGGQEEAFGTLPS